MGLTHYLHRRGERKYTALVRNAHTTKQLWRIFEQRVPLLAREYFRGAADDELSTRENCAVLDQMRLAPYGAVDIEGEFEMSTTMLGHKLSVPWFFCPVGSLRSLCHRAEAVAAQVAGEFGTAVCQSTLTGTRLEEVRDATKGPAFFQLYLCGGRETAERGIKRARDAGFDGLFLTIDTAISGNRAVHAAMQATETMKPFFSANWNGKKKLLPLKLQAGWQMLNHPYWFATHLADGGMYQFVNIIQNNNTPMPYADIGAQLASSATQWRHVEWIRKMWGDKPIVIKGVHRAEDARRASELGAKGVVWSNHGGRQLDGVISTAQMLIEEMPKVECPDLEHFVDGGFRNGRHLVLAQLLGVKAIGLGRVQAAGLGAGGYAGLVRAAEIVTNEVKIAMKLLGVQSLAELKGRGPEFLRKSILQGGGIISEFVF